MQEHKVSMLGTGLIGMFYTMALNGGRGKDRVQLVYSRTAERAEAFAEEWDIPAWTTDLTEACTSDDIDTVVIGLPNHIHEECVNLAADAGKAILCTKPPRPQRRRSQTNDGQGRSYWCLWRLSRRPLLHAQGPSRLSPPLRREHWVM